MKALIVIAAAVVLFSAACFPASPAKPALEVVVLGSGGPRAFGRAGSSYILVVEGRPRILVDAGPGAFLRIGELDLDLAESRHGFVDASAYRSQRGPGGLLQRAGAYQ